MSSQLTIRTRDLQRLCAVVDKAHLAHSDEPMPHSVLQALHDLVPCDEVTYQVFVPARKQFVCVQDFDGSNCYSELNHEEFKEFFWAAYWSSLVCSYPQRTDDKTGVRRAIDFLSQAELRASAVGELFRLQDVRHNVLVPLTPDGDTDYRIEFWRSDGPDFSDREQLLLTLLRPHLAELELTQRRRRTRALLTRRQTELLHLVAAGLSNRQVATRLCISEGTVRRHLENVYERLNVTSRTAAAAKVTGVSTTSSP